MKNARKQCILKRKIKIMAHPQAEKGEGHGNHGSKSLLPASAVGVSSNEYVDEDIY